MPDRFRSLQAHAPWMFSLPSALLVSALLYAWTLTYPINIDSSVHAYMASLIVKGYWPYVHVWENNFPGTIIFVDLPEFLLLGRSALAFHAWDVLWQLAGTFFLYKIVASLTLPSPQGRGFSAAAWLASVFAAIYYLSVDNLMVAQRDCYATVVLLAVLWLLGLCARGKAESLFHTTSRLAWCGVLYGIAILIRPTNDLYALFLALWLLYEDRSRRGAWKAFAFFTGAQVLLAVFGIVALASGALPEVYTIIIRFNTEVYSHFLPLGGLFYPFGKYWIILIGVPFSFVALTKRDRLFLGGLLLVSFLTVVPQKRYFYQYDTTFVLLILLSAVGWVWLFGRAYPRWLRAALPIFLAFFALAFLTRGTTQKRIFFHSFLPHPSSFIRSTTYWQYDTSSASGFAVLDSVGDYLALHTSPTDRVQFVGEYVYPLYYADRISATRFITFHSLMLRPPSGIPTGFQLQWRKELLDTMTKDPPLYVVIPDAPEYARGHLNGLLGHEILERDLTALDTIVRSRYHLETRIGAFSFYRRN